MINLARSAAVVLTVSLVVHAGVAAGVGDGPRERSADGIDKRLVAGHEVTEDRTVTDHTTRLAVSKIAAATPDDLPLEPVGLLACYSRFDESDPLENPTRRSLHDAVTSTPGQSVTTIARDVDVPVSTARYHVKVLEGEDIIERHRFDGRSRLYPADFGDDPELTAALAASAPAAVIAAVRSAQPISVTALAARTDLAPSTASYHVSRLTDAGVLEREKEGKTVRVSLSADTTRHLGDASEGGSA